LASLNRCNTGIPVPASWLNSIWHEPSVPNDMFVTSDVSEVATFRYLTELHHVAYLSVIESKSGAHRSTSSPIPLHRFTVQKKTKWSKSKYPERLWNSWVRIYHCEGISRSKYVFCCFLASGGPPTASNPYLLLFWRGSQPTGHHRSSTLEPLLVVLKASRVGFLNQGNMLFWGGQS
jgi:hypothetical protein